METRKRPVNLPDLELLSTEEIAQGAAALDGPREIELEILLEELAAVIESEGGILTS